MENGQHTLCPQTKVTAELSKLRVNLRELMGNYPVSSIFWN